MLTQRVWGAESRIENSSANGPPRVRSKDCLWEFLRAFNIACPENSYNAFKRDPSIPQREDVR